MVLVKFPIGVILLTSSDAGLCFVDIWNILVHISWHLLLVLVTSSFVWSILASSVILDIPHPLSCDSLVESSLWASCCLGHIFFLPCIQSHLISMIIHCPFPMLGSLPILWCHFFWFLPISYTCPLWSSFSTLLLLPWFFSSIVLPWTSGCLCYLLSC